MNRILSIAKYQFKGLSLYSLLSLIRKSLFRDDTIRIYVLRISQIGDMEPCALGEIEIKKGTISELVPIEERFAPVPWEFRCQEYDGVKDFFVAVNPDGIQHISWIYYQSHPNRIISLGPKDAEIKYCLTLPLFRGKGLYPEVLKTIARYLNQRGFCRVFISVNVDNLASIRGIEKSGFVHISEIRLRKIMGIQVSNKYVPPEI